MATQRKTETPMSRSLVALTDQGIADGVWKNISDCARDIGMDPTQLIIYRKGYVQDQDLLQRAIDRVKKRMQGEIKGSLASRNKLRETLRALFRQGDGKAWRGVSECARRVKVPRGTLQAMLERDAVSSRAEKGLRTVIGKMRARLRAANVIEAAEPKVKEVRRPEKSPVHHDPPDPALAERLTRIESALRGLKDRPRDVQVQQPETVFDTGAMRLTQGIGAIVHAFAQDKKEARASFLEAGLSKVLQAFQFASTGRSLRDSVDDDDLVISAPLADLLMAGVAELRNWEYDGVRFVWAGKRLKIDAKISKEEMQKIKRQLQETRRLLELVSKLRDGGIIDIAVKELGPELRHLIIAIRQMHQITPRDVRAFLEDMRAAEEATRGLST